MSVVEQGAGETVLQVRYDVLVREVQRERQMLADAQDELRLVQQQLLEARAEAQRLARELGVIAVSGAGTEAAL